MRTSRADFESAATKNIMWGIILWVVLGGLVAFAPIFAPVLFAPFLMVWRGMQLYAAKDAYDVNLIRAREDHWGEKGIDAHTGKPLNGMTGRIKPVHSAGSRTEDDVLGSADDDVDLEDLGEPTQTRPVQSRSARTSGTR
jgi:hypothetical protein